MTKTAPELMSGDFGPPLRGGQRRPPRRRRRVSTVLLGIVSVLTLGMAVAVAVVAQLGDGVAVVDIGPLRGAGQQQAADAQQGPVLSELEGVTNVLLVGTDSRAGLTDDDLLLLGTEAEAGTGLTDTIMLVQLDADEDRASVLSFPRDLWVERCDGSDGRINGAYNQGEEEGEGEGPRCLVETIEDFTGIAVDHYVQVDFQGFIAAVDELGGVSFYLDEPLVDEYAGLDVPAGCVTFDGAEALAFVRARHLGNPPDIGRIARQQRFMREMLDEVTSAETLRNPAQLLGFVRAMSNSITTDRGLDSARDRATLAWNLRELSNDGIDTHVVPAYEDEIGDASVLVPIDDEAEPLFAQFRAASFGVPSEIASAAPQGSAQPAPAEEAPATEQGASERDAQPTDSPPSTPSPEPTFAGAALAAVEC